MGFFDFLRKTGILRIGAESATYHTAKERPLSLQESGVFNSEKDVLNGTRPSAPPPVPSCPCATEKKTAERP